jgi:hypothetical protein
MFAFPQWFSKGIVALSLRNHTGTLCEQAQREVPFCSARTIEAALLLIVQPCHLEPFLILF